MKKSLMTVCALAILAGAGCADGGGMPAPQLTFANYQAQTLNVQSADVTEAYTNPNDPDDVSGQFVIAPSDAVKRYAARRFAATGTGNGQFHIVIEDSRVHLRQIPQKNKVLKWVDVGTEDEYHLWLNLRVTTLPDGATGNQTTLIKMDRTLIMPSSVTLADREMRQVKFLENLMADVDKRISDALDATPAIRP